MVHKKTEYRLQFQLLAKDLRKQIWQDNIQFRYILGTFKYFINCHENRTKSVLRDAGRQGGKSVESSRLGSHCSDMQHPA